MVFAQPQKNNRKHLRAIQGWIEDLLPDEFADCVVMVNELQCFEPGCAPLETVVTLLDSKPPRSFKLFKPSNEVTPEDVTTSLHQCLSTTAQQQPQHLTKS